jgi:dTDP-4-amino-4,6-dideoxygalactose transaminase
MTTYRIPYVALGAQHHPLRGEILEAVGGVLDSGLFILGEQVATLERRFAALCGTKHAVAVGSGTDALVLALRALEVGPGDEVITAPNSFVASASAIVLCGATPVFADVGADYNLDPAAVEHAITPRTRAIIPVHLTGRPADMDPILDIGRRHRLRVVEDCAQAMLAEYRGRRVGSFGAAGCFSLHPLKTFNACGDGGMLTTDDEALATEWRILRNIGLRTRDECVAWSGNSRLDTMQAAILLIKLPHLEAWTRQRRANAARYRAALGSCAGVRVPQEHAHERAVYHTFVIRAQRRDALKQHLAGRGIETAVHYPVPIHLQPVAASLGYARGAFPATEQQASEYLSLPVYPELGVDAIDEVAACIQEFYR